MLAGEGFIPFSYILANDGLFTNDRLKKQLMHSALKFSKISFIAHMTLVISSD